MKYFRKMEIKDYSKIKTNNELKELCNNSITKRVKMKKLKVE